MREVVCLCQEILKLDLPNHYNLDDPDIENAILSGNLMTVTCESCGTTIPTEERADLISHDRHWQLLFLPEISRVSYLAHPDDYKPEKIHAPDSFRVVIGFPELSEKIRIWRDGLDDSKMELLKFDFLLQQVNKNGPLKAHLDTLRLYYQETVAEKLSFTLMDDQGHVLGHTGVSKTRYEGILESLKNSLNPDDLEYILELPYVNSAKVKLS